MKAFDIQGNRVTFTPEFLAVPEFRAIWDRDKRKGKGKATKELSYVAFLCDNTTSNPYKGYSEEIRADILKEDFIRDKDWEEDDLVKNAVNKLHELMETPSSRLVASALVAADKLNDYYRGVDIRRSEDGGKAAKELQHSIKELAGTIKSLYTLNEQLKKEQLDSSMTRGGFEIGEFEIPSEDIDYGEDFD